MVATPAGADSTSPLVALAGNPNTGKTTLFNVLTGSTAKVGNYPGITVERHQGRWRAGDRSLDVVDVPGTYSLSARSEEERIALEAIAGLGGNPRPDVVVMVVDGTQLSRNLYLTMQVLELGLPVVVAVTMVDVVAKKGEDVDLAAVAEELGVPVVGVTATTGAGLDELAAAVAAALDGPAPAASFPWAPDGDLAALLEPVAAALPEAWDPAGPRRVALAQWALLSLDEDDEHDAVPDALRRAAIDARTAADPDPERRLIQARYDWIDAREDRFHPRGQRRIHERTDLVDRVLLQPLAGFALFLALMTIVFQALFSWADPMIGWVEAVVGAAGGLVGGALPEGLFRDFVVDGIIAGVGAVLVFLPQILLLFLFVGLMEDSGYMSRVAFLMDRVMRLVGLHGRAFVPMMSGFACAVPAVVATRTMERRRDRLLTMMVVPLMTCSARLPVYTLLIAVMARPGEDAGFTQGFLMAFMYLFATVVALVVAGVLSRTVIRGERVPLILEMPPYRFPHLPSVLRMLRQRASMFVKDAGGVILVFSMVMWALLTFPREPVLERDFAAERTELVAALPEAELEDALLALDEAEAGAQLAATYGGRLGKVIEPAIAPLGFDWKMGIGIVGAFAAREVFVSTMGIVYGLGDDQDETSGQLRDRLRAETRTDGRPAYTPLVCLSLLVFFALACQCMTTVAVVYRESGSWRWPAFLFGYTLALAWLASLAVYQGGQLLGFT